MKSTSTIFRSAISSCSLLPLFTLLYLFAAFISPHDPDLGYHLSIGNSILNTFTFPQNDTFRVDSTAPELAYSWLPGVFLALTEQGAGVLGLRLWIILTIFLITLISAMLIVSRRTIVQSVFLLVPLSLALFQICSPRPRLFAALLFVALLFFLREDTFSKGGSFLLKRIIAIFFIVSLWANSHISVFLALPVIAMFSVGCFLQKQKGYTMKEMALYLTAALLALFFNPYGLKLYTLLYDFSPYHQQAIASKIIELVGITEFQDTWPIWVAPNFYLFGMWILFSSMLLVRAVIKVKAQREISFRTFFSSFPDDFLGASLIATFFAVLSYSSARHAHLFSLAAIFALSCGPKKDFIFKPLYSQFGIILFIFATVVGMSQGVWGTYWYTPHATNQYYPVIAMEGLERAIQTAKKPLRILTPFSKGHFVTYWLNQRDLSSKAKVVLDGRIDLLGRSRFFPVFDAYNGICSLDTLNFFTVDIVLVEEHDELFEILNTNPEWVAISGDTIVSFMRTSLIKISEEKNI